MAASTTTTTLNDIVGEYIEEEFFGFQQPDLVIYKDAKKYPQARGAGDTAVFPIMRPTSRRTKTNESGTGSSAEGEGPTKTVLYTDSISVKMSKLDACFQVSFESWNTAIKALSSQVGMELRKNWNRSLEYNILSVLATRGNASRVDCMSAPQYQVGGTCDTCAAGTFVDATLSDADGYYDDWKIVITSGTGAGQVRIIDTWTNSTTSATLKTNWDVAPDTTSTYKLISTDGIDAGLPFGTEAFYIGRAGLLTYQAPKMGAATIFRVALDHDLEIDLLKDDVFRKTGMYHDSKKVDDGVIGRWLGCEVGLTSEGWYEDAGTIGTYSSTGGVHLANFYAMDTFGCVSPVKGGQGVGNVEFFNIMTPDSGNTTLENTYHSYRGYFASVVPFGVWVHTVYCGAGYQIPGDVHL